MTLQSMTGFARAVGQDDRYAWTWEARSVNSKGLDVRCRVPNGYEAVEQAVRANAGKRFKRCNITLGVSVERLEKGGVSYRVNRDFLEQVRALRVELAGDVADTPSTLEGLLSIRGRLETVDDSESDDAHAARQAAMIETSGELLDGLAAARGAEGTQLDTLLKAHLNALAGLVDGAAATAAAQPDAIRARLQDMVSELIDADSRLSQERLAPEAALLAGKADVRE